MDKFGVWLITCRKINSSVFLSDAEVIHKHQMSQAEVEIQQLSRRLTNARAELEEQAEKLASQVVGCLNDR